MNVATARIGAGAAGRLERAHLLICRTDNIGDVVLTLPLAGFLKQRFPAMRISFLCRSYAAPLVACCAAVDKVVEADRIGDLETWLAQARIDVVLFAKPEKKLARAARKAGIAQRVGTSHRWYHWLYCNRLAHFSRVKSALHEAQLNFLLLRPLGIDLVPAREELIPWYGLQAPVYRSEPALDRGDFNLILHPKSNGSGREWPIGHFAELARLLQRHADIRLWITGSQKEGELLAVTAEALLDMPNVVDVCGRFDLGELTAFMDAADGLVASSTGPLHMSAALGKPTLGLFPPVKPLDPGRWGAVGRRAETLVEELPCKGCDDTATCACMAAITPAGVAEVVLRWRAEKRAGRDRIVAGERPAGGAVRAGIRGVSV